MVFKPGDKVRVKVLDRYKWGSGLAEMREAIDNRTVLEVGALRGYKDVQIKGWPSWSLFHEELEFATRKPTIIIIEE